MARRLQWLESPPLANEKVASENGKSRYVKNRQVEFPLKDVYFPDKITVFEALHGETMIEGQMAQLTTGPEGEMFAVINLEHLDQPVLVPLRCVKEKS
ncbi:MAG: hypothetical protein C5B50_17390 [Verrucomicrobia bacterium]|nr:MAG: hypothetical protein C5B50_17390 [Verrucomicrobiota bacterium]